MAKNIEDLALDEITEEYLLDEAIAMGEELGVDVNQGSLYRDAADGHVFRAAKFFNDLSQVYSIISINTCTGDILDEKLAEKGMSRKPAADTTAIYYVEFVGAEPEEGDTVTVDGHFFTVIKYDGEWAIESEETGSDMNTLVPGLAVIPETDVDGLTSATLLELAVAAVDMEDDDSARERLLNTLSGPSESCNKAQLKSWCEGIEGVGKANIVALWNGAGTALGIIISSDGAAPSDDVVTLVQETIDPDAAGLGEGYAAIGCFFTAVAAEEVSINVSVSVSIEDGSSLSTVTENIQSEIAEYVKDLALSSTSDAVTVRYSRIGAMIANVDNVVDYDNLLVNEGTDNVECTVYQVPVIGEVSVNGDI